MALPALPAPLWVYAVGLVILLALVAVSLKPQRLRPGRLWIIPTIVILLTAFALSLEPLHPPAVLALDAFALAVGAAVGWWQARFTRIVVDPRTETLTSFVSPLGMSALLAVVIIRMMMRGWVMENASALHLAVNQVSDALLLLAVGLVCAQRVEMAIRAVRLLNATRDEKIRRRVSPVRSAPSRRR